MKKFTLPLLVRLAFWGLALLPAASAPAALKAEYYNGRNFDSLAVERQDPNIAFNWGSGSPDALVNVNEFSARWTGQLTAPASGNYTVYVVSDNGTRLRLNGAVVSEHFDTVTGTESGWYPSPFTFNAGQQVPFELEYYETYGSAEVTLYWQSETQPFEVIPASAFSLTPVAGWTARFFDGRTFERPAATLTGSEINADWNGAPVPELFPDNFSVKWSGCLTPTESDLYTFTIAADNGTRLWLNGALVVDAWHPEAGDDGGWRSVPVWLRGGEPVNVLLDYYQSWGSASAALFWASSTQPMAFLGGSAIKTLTTNQAPLLASLAWQNSVTGGRVDVPLIASDVEGDLISYRATGLPQGIYLQNHLFPFLNPRGLPPVTTVSLSGRPTAAGIYPVVVTATTPDGASVTQQFQWTVRGPALTSLETARELLQDSLLVTPAADGFRVRYAVPDPVSSLYEARLEISSDLMHWADATAFTQSIPGDEASTNFSLQINHVTRGHNSNTVDETSQGAGGDGSLNENSPRLFFRLVLQIR